MTTYNFIFEMVGYEPTAKRKSYENALQEANLQRDLRAFAREELYLQCFAQSYGIDNKTIDDAIANNEIRYVKLEVSLSEKLKELQEKIEIKSIIKAEKMQKTATIEINGLVLPKAEELKKKPQKSKAGKQSNKKVIIIATQTSSIVEKKRVKTSHAKAYDRLVADIVPKKVVIVKTESDLMSSEDYKAKQAQKEKLRQAISKSEEVIKNRKAESRMDSEIERTKSAIEKPISYDEFFRGNKEQFYKPQTRAVREVSNYYDLINQSF